MNRGTFCPTYKTFAINNPDQTHVTRPVKIPMYLTAPPDLYLPFPLASFVA